MSLSYDPLLVERKKGIYKDSIHLGNLLIVRFPEEKFCHHCESKCHLSRWFQESYLSNIPCRCGVIEYYLPYYAYWNGGISCFAAVIYLSVQKPIIHQAKEVQILNALTLYVNLSVDGTNSDALRHFELFCWAQGCLLRYALCWWNEKKPMFSCAKTNLFTCHWCISNALCGQRRTEEDEPYFFVCQAKLFGAQKNNFAADPERFLIGDDWACLGVKGHGFQYWGRVLRKNHRSFSNTWADHWDGD